MFVCLHLFVGVCSAFIQHPYLAVFIVVHTLFHSADLHPHLSVFVYVRTRILCVVCILCLCVCVCLLPRYSDHKKVMMVDSWPSPYNIVCACLCVSVYLCIYVSMFCWQWSKWDWLFICLTCFNRSLKVAYPCYFKLAVYLYFLTITSQQYLLIDWFFFWNHCSVIVILSLVNLIKMGIFPRKVGVWWHLCQHSHCEILTD